MNAEKIRINGIPAILWGAKSERLIIAVHGSHSSKIDDCVWILAEEADKQDFRTLSFDLPKHGERVYETEPCMIDECVGELGAVMEYARTLSERISLFGCSMGAYFGMTAYQNERLERAWLLSPVVDMGRLIRNIMNACGIGEEDLKKLGTYENPYETLYWDYYEYVKEHPIKSWSVPTSILRGENDTLSEREAVVDFSLRFGCALTEQKGGEHWFHTPEELEYYRGWLVGNLL